MFGTQFKILSEFAHITQLGMHQTNIGRKNAHMGIGLHLRAELVSLFQVLQCFR